MGPLVLNLNCEVDASFLQNQQDSHSRRVPGHFPCAPRSSHSQLLSSLSKLHSGPSPTTPSSLPWVPSSFPSFAGTLFLPSEAQWKRPFS